MIQMRRFGTAKRHRDFSDSLVVPNLPTCNLSLYLLRVYYQWLYVKIGQLNPQGTLNVYK